MVNDNRFIVFLLICCTCFCVFGIIFVRGKLEITQISVTQVMGALASRIQKLMGGEREVVYDFPDSLEGFGYHFNKEGQMRSIEGDEPFKFDVRPNDGAYNQKHYNAIGEIITEKVYELLEQDCKLKRTVVPTNVEEDEPKSFIFISNDFDTNKDKLMVLIHGNGVVRAGQWARRLIMNDCLDSGTQIPFIKWAQTNGYAVIVANPNLNSVKAGPKKEPIPIKGNKSPEEHVETIWHEFIQKSPASHIAIVAHSYGGVSTVEATKNHLVEFRERVFAIAFTDSVHSLKDAPPEVVDYYKENAKNWASAYDPLDAPLKCADPVVTVSAGTDKHELTSFSSMNSIFKYFTERYEAVKSKSSAQDSDQSAKEHSSKQPISDENVQTEEESKENSTNQKEDSNTDMNDQKTSDTQEKSASDGHESKTEVKEEL